MTVNEIEKMVMGIPGATMVRVGNTNCIAVPTENGYVKVKIGGFLDKDTKTHKAFDFSAAQADYQQWEVNAAERAAKRAITGPERQKAAVEAAARREALDNAIKSLPAFKMATSTDVFGMLPEAMRPKTVMMVGSALKRLAENGVVTLNHSEDEKDKKNYYTK